MGKLVMQHFRDDSREGCASANQCMVESLGAVHGWQTHTEGWQPQGDGSVQSVHEVKLCHMG